MAERDQWHYLDLPPLNQYEEVQALVPLAALQSANARLAELTALAKEVLERDSGATECCCINHSRKAEREYEAGNCPHQRLRRAAAGEGDGH
jgi:hypothetical protein